MLQRASPQPCFSISAFGRVCRWPMLTLALVLAVFTAFGAVNFDRLQSLAEERYGEATLARVQLWIKLLESGKKLPSNEQLHAVNDFFNHQLRFTTDEFTWQQNDYWATPLESLYKQEGDCEDFAMAKYVTLLLMGVAEDKLRLVYVQARIPGANAAQAHMVLAYYSSPNAEPLVLDNLVPQIQSANKRPDLSPVFSFNTSNLWVAGQSGRVENSQARLSKWQDALRRIRLEGFLDE